MTERNVEFLAATTIFLYNVVFWMKLTIGDKAKILQIKCFERRWWPSNICRIELPGRFRIFCLFWKRQTRNRSEENGRHRMLNHFRHHQKYTRFFATILFYAFIVFSFFGFRERVKKLFGVSYFWICLVFDMSRSLAHCHYVCKPQLFAANRCTTTEWDKTVVAAIKIEKKDCERKREKEFL